MSFLFLLLQITLERPFTYGAFGTIGIVTACVMCALLAFGVALLFRKGWSQAERAVGVLVLFSIAFLSLLFFAYAAFHDSLMEEEYRRAVERQAEASRRTNQAQTNSNTASNSDSR